ncbi:hypothetical protein K2173_024709 [Erythroxylum novogranatense]|uniref:Remorin C-terminal domain-containing protein n=1 Tax=Erythroxylum novogranatense TaxID=1862640 RepID=A0AAV8SV35_9ROSI|nr:hypothetical protein K2173_024709 [Erythroxylum novogranatense]
MGYLCYFWYYQSLLFELLMLVLFFLFLVCYGEQEPTMVTNTSLYGKTNDDPFADTFQDPLCKLNLKESSEFVKSFPLPSNSIECRGFLEVSTQRRREGVNSVTHRRFEAPPTPGRPVFSFSNGNLPRRSFPSKWDDAEKWLISSSCHDSPAHTIKTSESSKIHRQCESFKPQIEVFAEKSRVTEEKISKSISSFRGSLTLDHHHYGSSAFNGATVSADVLKDKFTDEVESVLPNLGYSEPSRQGFFFRNSANTTMRDAGTEVIHEVKLKDVGTDMTPLGSSTTSRCHTPFKISSPARHNTPTNMSGPLASVNYNSTCNTIDISKLQDCHLAKLQIGSQYDSLTSNWSSREEEEEDISKSLRHFETGIASRKSISDSRAAAWEDEEKTKYCLRYQREEAKIQAWVNLQSAQAEAESRKLEVKIEKMRSNLEEKLMKRMAIVHRKAEEWRAAARVQHTEQIQKATEHAKRMISQHNLQLSSHSSCGCFPCRSNH